MLDESSQKYECGGMYRSPSNMSNLEKNCNQLFTKGPALTKDFFEKIQADMMPQKTDLFGYQMNTRRLLLLTGLFLLFTASTMGTITMWFTNFFQESINELMVISPESPAYEMWKSPPPRPYAKFHIFNYTNVEDYENGNAEKLNVEEIGPYTYHEQLERVNVRFNRDGTVSYQEKRTYRFSPELSKGFKDDLVTVPNVPLFAGAALMKNYNFLMRLSYSGLLKSLSEKPFVTLKADSFIIGYEDDLYDISKSYLKFQDKKTFDNIGLLVWKEGVQPDVITINTGAKNFSRLGLIEKFNGQEKLDLWSTDDCNRMQVSNGILYPSSQVKTRDHLKFFLPQMCSSITANFQKESSVLDRIPVYRYVIPEDLFDSPETNSKNECYCNHGDDNCGIQGVFNATSCVMGAPFFYSWPYFYKADRSVQEGVTGLKSPTHRPENYMDVHPDLGYLLGGKTSFQVNMQVHKAFGISELNSYEDGLMLPMVWVETGLEEKDLPANMVEMIHKATFTVQNLEIGLKYGCLLGSLVTFSCILIVLKRQRDLMYNSSSRSRSRSSLEAAE